MGHGDADPATVKQLEAKLTESLDYYQDLLSKQKFLGGDVSGERVVQAAGRGADHSPKELYTGRFVPHAVDRDATKGWVERCRFIA